MTGEPTSLSLLVRLSDGNSDAWQEFHDLYGPLLRGWLLSKGVQPANLDDLLQEVWEVALAELPGFRHNGHTGALRTWLRRVLANRLREFWRKGQRQPTTADSALFTALGERLADPHSDLSEARDQEYRHAVCARLLLQVEPELAEKTVLAFRRVAIENQQPGDVASELSMTVNAVRISQSRVMRRLRELGQGMLD